MFVRNSGAGNGCANFMDAWKKCGGSAGKPVSIKFLVLGGGVFWVLGGGGEVPILVIPIASTFFRVSQGIALYPPPPKGGGIAQLC